MVAPITRKHRARDLGVSVEVLEAAMLRSGDPRHICDVTQTLETLRAWWCSDECQSRGDAVARYRLWFPDRCGISPEEALVERLEFQRRVAAAWAAVERAS